MSDVSRYQILPYNPPLCMHQSYCTERATHQVIDLSIHGRDSLPMCELHAEQTLTIQRKPKAGGVVPKKFVPTIV